MKLIIVFMLAFFTFLFGLYQKTEIEIIFLDEETRCFKKGPVIINCEQYAVF